MRVPLIWPVDAIISRLDTDATRALDPAGTPASGYDDIFREPYPLTNGTTDTRIYISPAVTVPVQVETKSFEELRITFGGDAPVSTVVLVAHRMDLSALGLITASTGRPLIKKGDRIDKIEAHGSGRTVLDLTSPLYIWEILPASWGFGPDGYDLEIIYTSARPGNTAGTMR